MKKKYLVISVLVIGTGIIGGFVQSMHSFDPITSCEPVAGARPLCGWQNPEDMVALPDGQHVIVSEFGDQTGVKKGQLSLLNLETESKRVLYSGGAEGGGSEGGSFEESQAWGTANCQAPAENEFSPHGIHLSQRADGTIQLLVVQHSGRESVEMFEVGPSPNGWDLAWRGCVIAPKGSMLNDVVATPEGGFLVTHMMTQRSNMLGQFFEYMRSSVFGVESGYVLAWQPREGFSQLQSSQGQVANGIEIAADGETIFVNYSGSGEVRRINRHRDEVEASNTSLPPLDNSSWTLDGHLLVAGARASALEIMPCTNLESGSCPAAFAIFSIDPQTLESSVVYESDANTPIGAGTVGLRVADGSLLIGSFVGDLIVRITPQNR
ncbi:MAG: hypothetical protein AAF708_02255 [Deinococcota bacterium]